MKAGAAELVRLRLLSDSKSSGSTSSGTKIKSPDLAWLRKGGSGPRFIKSKIETGKSRQAIPPAGAAEPAQKKLRKNATKPVRTWLSTDIGKSGQIMDRVDTELPKRVHSATGGEDTNPALTKPDIKAVKPK